MISYILGKSLTWIMIFTYINKIVEPFKSPSSVTFNRFLCTSFPLNGQNPLSWPERFCWHPLILIRQLYGASLRWVGWGKNARRQIFQNFTTQFFIKCPLHFINTPSQRYLEFKYTVTKNWNICNSNVWLKIRIL